MFVSFSATHPCSTNQDTFSLLKSIQSTASSSIISGAFVATHSYGQTAHRQIVRTLSNER